jgi:hypothetical protein
MKDISAFPTPAHNLTNDGMTLRDYFAAKAMQVVLYQCDCFPDEDWRMGVALDSYQMADDMLKARNAAQ